MTTRKHIAFVVHALQMGGAERVLTSLASQFSTRGYKVTIITLDTPQSGSFFDIPSEVDVLYLSVLTPRKSTLRWVRSLLSRFFVLRRAIQNVSPDTVISFIDWMNVTTLLSLLGTKSRILVCERTNPYKHRINPLISLLRRLTYGMAHGIVVQTKLAARYFQCLSSEKIYIIPNSISQPRHSRPVSKDSCTRLISIGRLTPSKNHELLIRAFACLLPKHPKLTLTIYGEGEQRQHLETLIANLGLGKHISLPGTIKDVICQLARFDLFVFPSTYEGFPNALGEAMAAGLPVVATNISGNVDLVSHNETGLLVEVGSENQLSEAMNRLLIDRKERTRLAQQGRESITKFSIKHILKLWENLI